jgi:cation-transporting ATPase 13A2
MAQNLPFVITIVATVLFSMYLLLDPAEPLAEFMQLTYLSINFKIFLLVLAAGGFTCAYIAERQLFPLLARMFGRLHDWLWPQRKKVRKEYKILMEKMRF